VGEELAGAPPSHPRRRAALGERPGPEVAEVVPVGINAGFSGGRCSRTGGGARSMPLQVRSEEWPQDASCCCWIGRDKVRKNDGQM
jgi:hypothetical protein